LPGTFKIASIMRLFFLKINWITIFRKANLTPQ